MFLRVLLYEEPFNQHYNIGFDEALLESVLKRSTQYPILRIWRNSRTVVLGALSRISDEVNLEFVDRNGIVLARRISGGGTVYHDLGNINYTLVIDKSRHDKSRLIGVDYLYKRLLKGLIYSLEYLGVEPNNIRIANSSDIVVGDFKVSGNASVMRENTYLLHGTLLISADMYLLKNSLIIPPRNLKKKVDNVKYRVTNLTSILNTKIDYRNVIEALVNGFSTLLNREPYFDLPSEYELNLGLKLFREKYSNPKWIYRK